MTLLPTEMDRLVSLLSRLPGVGERSATRLAFFILSEPASYAHELGASLGKLPESVRSCQDCHMITDGDRCATCLDPSRDRHTLCVVESVADLLAFERTGAYAGLYHVLHGVLSPLKGVGPGELRLDNLEARIERDAVRELIIATNTDVEGEATALYLARRLGRSQVKVTRIATGVPLGGELEYIDQNTLGRALEGRRELRA